MLTCMCTAYEFGKRSGRFPVRLTEEAAAELSGLEGLSFLRPTLRAPVVDAGGRLEVMRWGFSRPFSHAVVNAREDKLEGVMWKAAMSERRCLIPAAAYYEWSGPKGAKRTHRFTHAAGEWLWIAGIWEEHAELGKCFSMITTEPTGAVLGVHDRMPAVLLPEETGVFLDGGMRTFRPVAGLLQVADTANPLVKAGNPPRQGELF